MIENLKQQIERKKMDEGILEFISALGNSVGMICIIEKNGQKYIGIDDSNGYNCVPVSNELASLFQKEMPEFSMNDLTLH